MSLIIEAIKKAQQLRLKDLKGTPFFKGPDPRPRKSHQRKHLRNLAALGFCLLLVFLGTLTYSRWKFQENQALVSTSNAPAPEAARNDPQGLQKEEASAFGTEWPSLWEKYETDETWGDVFKKRKAKKKKKKKVTLSLETEINKAENTLAMEDEAPVRSGEVKQELRKPPITTNSSLPPRIEYGVNSGGGPQMSLDGSLLLQGQAGIPAFAGMTFLEEALKADSRQALSAPLPEDTVQKPAPASPKQEALAKAKNPEIETPKKQMPASEVLIHFNSGVDLYHQRDYAKAAQAYQKVIELDPGYAEAYNNLGIIYQEAGDLDRALSSYQKAIETNPRYEKAFNNLGILLYLKGRYEESIQAFKKALAINPDNIESHINLGILFKKQGRVDQAIGSYQKALSLNPLHGETHYNMALLYEHLGNIETATGHYQKFVQMAAKTHPELVAQVKRHLNYLMTTKK